MREPEPASGRPPAPRRAGDDEAAAPSEPSASSEGRDGLTGLADRTAFLAALQAALVVRPDDVALMLVGLDGFCCVDEHHGAGAADRLLRRVAGCLAASVRPGDVTARLRGDAFAVVLQPPAADADVHGVVRRIADALADSCDDDGDLPVRPCLGVAHSSEAPDAEGLLRLAARAVNRARDGAGHA